MKLLSSIGTSQNPFSSRCRRTFEQVVLTQFREALEAERAARTESLRLQMQAVRRIMRYLISTL